MITRIKASKFESWVRSYGVQKLSAALTGSGEEYSASWSAVYGWLRGEHAPRRAKARLMEKLSGGRVTRADIQQHIAQRRAQGPANDRCNSVRKGSTRILAIGPDGLRSDR